MQTGQMRVPLVKEIDGKTPQFNLPVMNNDDLFKEIEEADKQSNIKKDLEDSEIEDADISGSDSEPSLDNFDNEELVKLLPTFVKKKSKFFFY